MMTPAEEFEDGVSALLVERYPGMFTNAAWRAVVSAMHYEAVHSGLTPEDAVQALRAAADLLHASIIGERDAPADSACG